MPTFGHDEGIILILEKFRKEEILSCQSPSSMYMAACRCYVSVTISGKNIYTCDSSETAIYSNKNY